MLDKPDKTKPDKGRSVGCWAIAAAAAVLFVAFSGLLLHWRFFRSADALATPEHTSCSGVETGVASWLTWLTGGGAETSKLLIGSATLESSLPGEVSEFYGAPDFKARDAPDEFLKEGGEDKQAQIYGEVTPAGMYAMLSHAMCLATQEELPSTKCEDGADDETIRKLAPDYRFFDLGSGAGKYPFAAALLGFQSAKGIELDTKRAELASTHHASVLAKYPCLSGTLTTEQGSFLKKVDWTKGPEPRVIFLDAVFFGKVWPDVSALMKKADWGAGTVVMALGRKFEEAESGLKQVSSAGFEVSWTKSSPVYFYKRA